MKITIFLRRAKDRPTRCTMRCDFTSETSDTPRIHNLGLDIKEQIDAIIAKCEAAGAIQAGKGIGL